MTVTSTPSTGDIKVAIAHTYQLIADKRPDLAEQQAAEILRTYPGDTNALCAIGAAQRLQKKYKPAITHLEQAVKNAPSFAMAQQELGLSYSATGRISEAIATLNTAVNIDKSLSNSWKTLGELYLADENESAADHAFQQHLKSSTKDPELIEAVDLVNQKKIAQAERVCRNYLKRKPTDVSAIRLLADIGIKLKIFGDAEKLLERCLELAPDYHLARLNYASALSGRQKPQLALDQLVILEQAEPEKPTHLILKASVLAQIGDYKEAIACYEKLLTQYRPQAKISMSYGHALKTVGRQQDAINAYQQAILMDPALGEAYWSLANLKTFQFSEQQIEAMKATVHSGKSARADFYHLCFALGKALEDLEQYPDSFKYYERGNQVKKRQEGYSSDKNHQQTQQMISICTTELFSSRKGQGCPQADPIFIVGLPRSGSTLLEQILASHSQVDGTKELPDIIAIARQLGGQVKHSDESLYPNILSSLSPEQLLELGKDYLSRARIQRGNAPFFIDKMPNNFAHIGLIQLLLPNAKIIDARRHPMDACFSGYKQLFASGQRFSYSLADIGRYYRDYVELMDHWDQVFPDKILRIQYEDVVANTEQEVRKILDYCGLAFEESCLNFFQTDRAVRTASSEQVRQPIYQSAIAQWRHYEAHLQPLTKALGPVMDRYPLN